jgi:NDP-hexose 4-ketoreductase
MEHVIVLGQGWLGRTVVEAAAGRFDVSSIDPPLDPVMGARDGAAAGALRDMVTSTGATAVINACGLLRGDDAELKDANSDFPRWVCDTIGDLPVRFIHVGSASEYGDPGSADPVGEDAPVRAEGIYATTKAAGSRAVLEARDRGLDAMVARVFNLVGYPAPPSSPLHQWITDLRELPDGSGEVVVWWPPTTRDFIRIDDAATALLDLAVAGDRPSVVNVCSGVGLAYGDIVEALASRMGLDVRVASLDRPGIETVVGDASLLGTITGRAPRMDLDTLVRTALPDEALGEGRGDGADSTASR